MTWMKTKWAWLVLALVSTQALAIPEFMRDDDLISEVNNRLTKLVNRLNQLEGQLGKLETWSKQAQSKQDALSSLTEDQRAQLESQTNQLSGRSDQMSATVNDLDKQLQDFKTEANKAIGDLREGLSTLEQHPEGGGDKDEAACDGEPVSVELNGRSFQACEDEQALFEAGREAWNDRQWQEAIALLSELRTAHPQSGYMVAALFYQAHAHIELGQRAAARVYVTRLRSQFPDQDEQTLELEKRLNAGAKKKARKA